LVDNAPLAVALLLIIDSLHFVFARLLVPYLPPTAAAMFVLGIGTVEVAVILRIRGGVRLAVFRRYAWFFLTIGFLAAASTTLNYAAVAFIDPGVASLLSRMSVLFGLGFGLVWLRERLNRLEALGAVIALGGVFVITFQPGDYLRLGSLLVLASALMYALHAALVKRHVDKMGLAEFFLFRLTCTTGFLFLFTAVRGELAWPVWPAWTILLTSGTVSVMLGRGLYYVALRRLRLSLHSLVLTLSPVATIGWTLLLFGISPTLQQMIGGAAVIAGIFMVSAGKLEESR
jgi:drug/metabolite transporter (DMT)-like permease